MPCGRWMRQVVMTRKGCAYSRTDNVAIALNGELKSANESANRRLYNKMYVDPWTVFGAKCRQDSLRNFRSNFDGPPLGLAQIKERQYFQSRVDPSTTPRCRFFTGPPGDPTSKPVRFFDRGEIIGPVFGTAQRTYMAGAAYFVAI
eukprot:5448817-Pyramimonas_sp.AAC.1